MLKTLSQQVKIAFSDYMWAVLNQLALQSELRCRESPAHVQDFSTVCLLVTAL